MNLTSPLSEETNRFLPLLLVLTLAFLVPIILSRFRRVPVVVGELMAGIIIGPTLLGWVTEGPILTFMSDIGLAFLMFLAGMEIDLGKLFPRRLPGDGPTSRSSPSILPSAVVVYGLTLALAIAGGLLLRELGTAGDPWLLAFVLSATSLGVVLPILKERGMLSEQFGQFILVNATLADFVTVTLLTVYIITLDRGLDLEILSLALLFLAFLIFYRVGPSFIRLPRVRGFFEDLSQATVQIKVRGAIAIMMAFVVLAEFVDAELILGAFLAGMIISLLKGPEDEALVHKLEAFGFGFFIPVFFILVGVQLDLGSLFEDPAKLLLVPELLLVSLIVKVVPMAVLRRRFSGRQLLAGGLLLNSHLSLEIAVAVIGLRTGLLDAAASTDIILFAVITVMVMPLLFNAILPYVPQRIRRHMLLVGVNDLGIRVAQELRAHGENVRFLEDAPPLVEQAQRAGFQVIESPPSARGLEGVDLAQVETVLALGEDEGDNLAVAQQAKNAGLEHIVVWVQDPKLLPAFRSLGVQPFTPAMHRVTMIAMMARNPDTYTLLTSTTDQRDIDEASLFNSSLVGRRLRDLHLPGDFLVLSIRRDEEMLVPRGNTALQYGDRLVILGDIAGLEALKGWLEGRSTIDPLTIMAEPQPLRFQD